MYRALIIVCLIFFYGCNNTAHVHKRNGNDSQVESINFKVVKKFPHDTGSFTEGFLFHDNQLFESTGSPEDFPSTRSVFGPVDLKTGKIDVKAELDRKIYFGEGIVFFGDKIYQLTYKNQTGFIYDSKTYKQTGTFKYSNKEGWALTTDGKSIIMSDGTNVITYLDPDSLHVIKKLNVTFYGQSALDMNELEYVKGYIYANIWTTTKIAKIDPASGKVVGIIDLSSLHAEAAEKNPEAESTNGIAYDEANDRFLVTGKFWPEIYQIRFPL
jgi:glutamine cyclotransferase